MSSRPSTRPGFAGRETEPTGRPLRSFELAISSASAAAMQMPQPMQVSSVNGGYRLGGANNQPSSVSEARTHQDRVNQKKIELFKIKEHEKKMKKLEEKLARDPRLNAATAPGNRLGQDESSRRPSHQKEDGKALREMRIRQQEKYNASMKPSAM